MASIGTAVTFPVWNKNIIWLLAPAVMAFAGGLLGNLWSRHSAQREESMRMLRWAVELACASDEGTADMGLALLDTLITSKLIRKTDKPLVEAIGLAVQKRRASASFGNFSETDYNVSNTEFEENK